MGGRDVDDAIDVLAKRNEFVAELAAGAREKPELVETLDVARSTVERALRELEAAGYVQRGDDGYRLTATGTIAHEIYADFDERLDALWDARDVVSVLSPTHADEGPGDLVPPDVLVDADVTRTNRHAPDRVVYELVSMVQGATRVQGVSPVAHGAYVEAFDEQIHERGMEVTLVFTSTVLEELATTYADAMSTTTLVNGVQFYEIPDLPPVGLLLAEFDDGHREVGVAVYDDTGLRAFAHNDTDDAVAWAESRFEYYRDRSDPVSIE